MNDLQLFEMLRSIIMIVTGVPECVLADQNNQAPSGSYAAIKPHQNINQRGQANINYTTVPTANSVTVEVRAQIMATCSVNFYRANANNYAKKLLQANKRPDVSAILFLAGVGWNNAGPVNNLTSLQSANFEERAQISIVLMYETSDPVVINSIEYTSISIENEDAETIVTTHIKTPDAPTV